MRARSCGLFEIFSRSILRCGICNFHTRKLGRVNLAVSKPKRCPKYIFQAGCESLRHPLRIFDSCNCDVHIMKSNFLGIADGVNSVLDENIDPTKLSHQLLSQCVAMAGSYESDNSAFALELIELCHLIGITYDARMIAKNILCSAVNRSSQQGSTTLCFSFISGNQLHIANLGDSGMMLFRLLTSKSDHGAAYVINSYSLIASTRQGFYDFDFPHQISNMPEPTLPKKDILIRNTYLLTDVLTLEIQNGDVVVIASDGVLDNLFLDEIETILNKFCLPSVLFSHNSSGCIPSKAPDEIARMIVQTAIDKANPYMNTESGSTPFSKKLSSVFSSKIHGGKCDDTTAIVGYIQAVLVD